MKQYKTTLVRIVLALLTLGMTAVAMAGDGSVIGPVGG